MPQVIEQLLKVDGSSGLLWDKAREAQAGNAGEMLTVHSRHRGNKRRAERRPAAVNHLLGKASWKDGVACLNMEAFERKADFCKTRKVRRVNRLILNPDPRTWGNLLSLEKTLLSKEGINFSQQVNPWGP